MTHSLDVLYCLQSSNRAMVLHVPKIITKEGLGWMIEILIGGVWESLSMSGENWHISSIFLLFFQKPLYSLFYSKITSESH